MKQRNPSRTVSELVLKQAAPITIFEALTVVRCGRCGKDIQPQQYFSRSADKAGRVPGIRYAHCRICVPLDEYVRTPEEVEEVRRSLDALNL